MTTALIIMAKAPEPGLSKSRLIPALGARGAADLAARMLHHTLKQALATSFERIELCVSPDLSHEIFQEISTRNLNRLTLTCQISGTLGQRMHDAFSRNLLLHRKVILIVTDAPAMTTAILQQAEQALNARAAVFAPAHDGGYVLVGLTENATFLFDNMAWSTSQVMAQTRQRLREHQWLWKELDAMQDIDEPDDLRFLPDGWLA